MEALMSVDVVLPKIGFSMTEGVLAEWLVADGGQTVEGKTLYSLESEKSVQEVESPATGTLRILKPKGETYSVGTVLAVIE
jgi:pyruvate/2-oxoglutarate dehydrogenase complex dihydrolipoamide acyltransferase (E2) component